MEQVFKYSYLKILRIDHWFKNLFVLTGLYSGLWFRRELFLSQSVIVNVILAFLLASFVSSSNYIINQIADAEFDKKHPIKKKRPIPLGKVKLWYAFIISIILFVVSFLFSLKFYSINFSISIFLLWLAGILYNIKPARFKDIVYLDVLSESANNPIRFLIGWFSVVSIPWPPVSVLILTWSAGAILMTLKRYDELRFLGRDLVPYRRTFKSYSLSRLKYLSYLYSVITLVLLFYISLVYIDGLLITIPLVAVYIWWILRTYLTSKRSLGSVEQFAFTPKFILFTLTLLLAGIIVIGT